MVWMSMKQLTCLILLVGSIGLLFFTTACTNDNQITYLSNAGQSESSNRNSQPTVVSLLTPLYTYTPTNTPTPTLTPTPSKTPTLTPTPSKTPTLTPTPTPTRDPAPTRLEIGRSVLNQPIEVVRIGNGDKAVLLVGGLHAGFAPSTVTVAEMSVSYFSDNPTEIPDNITLYIITSANPDSPYAPNTLQGRLNANGVDLNRNWPCEWVQDARWRNSIVKGSGGNEPLSEPETKSLANFIQEIQPVGVVFWAAIYRDNLGNGLVSPGSCGYRTQVSGELATTYGSAAIYNIGDFERGTGQIVNGDSVNWLDDQGIPAVAVLLPYHETLTDWEDHLAGIRAVLQMYATSN